MNCWTKKVSTFSGSARRQPRHRWAHAGERWFCGVLSGENLAAWALNAILHAVDDHASGTESVESPSAAHPLYPGALVQCILRPCALFNRRRCRIRRQTTGHARGGVSGIKPNHDVTPGKIYETGQGYRKRLDYPIWLNIGVNRPVSRVAGVCLKEAKSSCSLLINNCRSTASDENVCFFS